MTKHDEIVLLERRIQRLQSRGDKNLKAPGVINRCKRKLAKLKAEEAANK